MHVTLDGFSNVPLWISLPQTPSQQAAMLDNDQEGVTGSNQWAPYSLGRRDVPPDNLMKKVRAFFFSFLENDNDRTPEGTWWGGKSRE